MGATTTRVAAAGLAAALLLGAAACGDDGGGDGKAAGSAYGTADKGAFCDKMRSFVDLVSSGNGDEATRRQALDQLAAIDPPAELKDAWATLLATRDKVGDPSAFSAEEKDEITQAGEKLGVYAQQNCDIAP
jgi:hypothetical protein